MKLVLSSVEYFLASSKASSITTFNGVALMYKSSIKAMRKMFLEIPVFGIFLDDFIKFFVVFFV